MKIEELIFMVLRIIANICFIYLLYMGYLGTIVFVGNGSYTASAIYFMTSTFGITFLMYKLGVFDFESEEDRYYRELLKHYVKEIEEAKEKGELVSAEELKKALEEGEER